MKEEAALARTVIKKRLAGQPAPDIWFLIILMLLVCYGLVMLFSAGYAVALYRRGDAYTYIRPQLLFAAFGAAAMYAASLVDYHIWHKLAWPIMGVSLALLAIVLFMPEYNGCKRWIVLPGLGTLQPSEIAKFAVVLVFAHIISLNHDRMQTFATGVLPFMVILGAVTVLMLLEPHLSGTLLILGIGAVLMFVGGTGLKWFALAGIAGAGAIAAAVVLLPELVPYAMGRLSSWRDPFADPLGEGHQTIQSLYAIASGGAAGLGLVVILCIAAFLLCLRNKEALLRALPIGLTALMAPAWLALLRTHSIQHGWFTWRSLTVSIFAGLAFLYYSCGIRAGLRRLRGQKQQG